MKYRIAIVVHGRFYAFDVAKAMLARGHDVRLFTNYPRWAVARFGFPKQQVVSCWGHGLAARALWAGKDKWRLPYPEKWVHESFGRWAARTVGCKQWDAVYCFSGVAEELFRTLDGSATPRWLVRGSSHIRTQARLLAEEERRAGLQLDKPSHWIIEREEREYATADVIVTLSGFARATFDGTGHQRKVVMVPLGVDVSSFRPAADRIEARRQRILRGAKLRVLFVGAKSFRKGLIDLAHMARVFAGRFDFRFVGPEEPRARTLLGELRAHAELVPVVPEAQLPKAYEWGDVFVFPTIEDGFAVVLTQAYAAGLPILTTTNCGAPDFIRDGETGWILPIRSPDAFVERLNWCDRHRAELATIVGRVYHEFKPRTWDDVAVDYENALEQFLPGPIAAEQRVHS